MSSSNVLFIAKPIEPPPLDTPIYVDGRDGKTVGSVDFKKNFQWAVWLAKLTESTTQYVVSATVDFGTIAAQNHKTELIALPTGFPNSQQMGILPIYPPTPDALLLSAHMTVLGLHLVAVGHNYGTVGLTPGPLNLQWLLTPRR